MNDTRSEKNASGETEKPLQPIIEEVFYRLIELPISDTSDKD